MLAYNKADIAAWLVVLYYLLVILAPRVTGESGNIRYEDFLTPFLVFALAFNIRRRYSYISTIIFVYCATLIVVSLFNIGFGQTKPFSFLVLGKEIQYYIVFLLMLFSFTQQSVDFFLNKVLYSVLLIVAIFAMYNMFLGKAQVYGLPYINEISPSLSSIMYFNSLILSIVLFQSNRGVIKYVSLFLVFLFAFSVIATASRTGFAVMVLFSFIYLFSLLQLRGQILFVCLVVVISVLLYLYRFQLHDYLYLNKPDNPIFHNVYGRLKTLLVIFDNREILQSARLDSWSNALSVVNSQNIFFGNGRGYFSATDGYKGLGTDGQITRNIAEIGLIGSGLFFAIFFGVFFHIKERWKKLYRSYFFSYLVWSVFAEIFLLTKGAQMFWLISALLIVMSNSRSELEKDNIHI